MIMKQYSLLIVSFLMIDSLGFAQVQSQQPQAQAASRWTSWLPFQKKAIPNAEDLDSELLKNMITVNRYVLKSIIETNKTMDQREATAQSMIKIIGDEKANADAMGNWEKQVEAVEDAPGAPLLANVNNAIAAPLGASPASIPVEQPQPMVQPPIPAQPPIQGPGQNPDPTAPPPLPEWNNSMNGGGMSAPQQAPVQAMPPMMNRAASMPIMNEPMTPSAPLNPPTSAALGTMGRGMGPSQPAVQATMPPMNRASSMPMSGGGLAGSASGLNVGVGGALNSMGNGAPTSSSIASIPTRPAEDTNF
jgi:hypothetical protein